MRVTRRNFIKVSSLAGGGMIMSLSLPLMSKTESSKAQSIEMNNFMSINSNGQITFLLTKHEMGQGTGTGIPMIFADELGADWSKVVIKRADYDPKFTWREMGTTGGSGSVERIWHLLRQVAATTREMLRQAAALHWEVPLVSLKVENSFVINITTNEKLEFGELANAASKLSVPENVRLKSHDEFVFIGKPVKNIITKDVIIGKSNYGIDMNIPDMVYASIEKCPVYKGKLKSYNADEARNIEGVLDIFPIKLPEIETTQHIQEGVVVVATSTWTAFKTRKQLKIEWDLGHASAMNNKAFEKDMTSALEDMEIMLEIGSMEKELKNPQNEVIEATYDNPHQAHALMEPINATVLCKNDQCEVWVGTQDGGIVRTEVAKILAIPNENVTVHILNSGGSFGRRYHVDSSIEASLISRIVKKPVKLTWTREDEVMHDHFHPYQRNHLRATITQEGEVSGIENKAIKTDDYVSWVEKWDQNYYFPNISTYKKTLGALIHLGAWRSVAEHSSSLSKECFIDELAYKTGKDPIDFRLQLLSKEPDLGDPSKFPDWVKEFMLPRRQIIRERLEKVLTYIKTSGLWERQMPVGQGKGFAIEKFGQTVCAHIAEVSMDDPDHGFRVDKVTSVVHCGTVINPHFGRGQIEGAIIWALSALKYGGLEIENGVVQRSNFHNNKVVRMDDSPEIEVIFINSTDDPSGLGEPGTPPLAPAVLNAIFNASGKRIRKIPVTKKDIDSAPII